MEWGALWWAPHSRAEPWGVCAAGVQGSVSSCNIPHLKYEAKFLLILHEKPGINCVLPISSSTVLQSFCLQPQSSSKQRLSQSSLFPPCCKLKDNSLSRDVHGAAWLWSTGQWLLWGCLDHMCYGFHHRGHRLQVVLLLKVKPSGDLHILLM